MKKHTLITQELAFTGMIESNGQYVMVPNMEQLLKHVNDFHFVEFLPVDPKSTRSAQGQLAYVPAHLPLN